MKVRAGRWVFKGVYRSRLGWVMLGLVLLSGLAMAGWSSWSAQARGTPATQAVRPTMAGQAQPAPDERDFHARCIQPVTERLYQRAQAACEAFLAVPRLAGRAHATLAALHTTRLLYDPARSVRHAREAVRLGDARGQFLMAAHMLTGHLDRWSPHEVQTLLQSARQGGVAPAQGYLQSLAGQAACAEQARLKPLGVPVFCLFRAQLIDALLTKGMMLRSQDPLQGADELSAKGLLEADRVELLFDTDPQEQLPRLARLQYHFLDDARTGRWEELLGSLQGKYGPPHTVQGGRLALWPMADGTRIRLEKPGARDYTISYEHDERLRQRDEHLRQAEAAARHEALVAEAQAF